MVAILNLVVSASDYFLRVSLKSSSWFMRYFANSRTYWSYTIIINMRSDLLYIFFFQRDYFCVAPRGDVVVSFIE